MRLRGLTCAIWGMPTIISHYCVLSSALAESHCKGADKLTRYETLVVERVANGSRGKRLIRFRQGRGEVGERRIERASNNCLYRRFSDYCKQKTIFQLSTHHLEYPAPNGTSNFCKTTYSAVIIMSASTHDHWSRHEFPGRARDAPRHWSSLRVFDP